MNKQPFFLIEKISKRYPGVQALLDVSFEIQRGELHALVGENGAGKSTLIKILAGATPQDEGKLCIDGQQFEPRSPRDALDKGISTIYQVFNLMPERSIKHNILLGKESQRGSPWLDLKEMNTRARSILEKLDAGYLDPEIPVRELKVGEQQIVEIAKALMNDTRFLIMDEPTAALNHTEVRALFKNIERLRTEGVTILYVSHHLEEVFELADRVTVLRDGQHILTAPISEVTERSLIVSMIGREVSSLATHKTEPTRQEVLRVQRLSAKKALKDVSFTLHKGEILAVAGLSGSGKTELGKALFGDLHLDSGQIFLMNKPYRPSPMHAIQRKMIYLPEDRKNDSVIQGLSIRRNITLSILPRLSNALGVLDLAQEKQLAHEQIQNLEIKTPDIEKLAGTLSGGNQQKVALARCLAVDPEVFILMEPTQGIDVGVKFEIYQFIAEQSDMGRSILWISSELAEILGLAHRVLVMHEGSIAADLEAANTSEDEILRFALGAVVTNSYQ